jgi:hypothetical protein
MEIKVDKLDIANQMLDSAIEEFLDKKRYFSSLNSAGVASEIYAKAIRINGGKESQRDVIEAAIKLTQKWNKPEPSIKGMKKIANHLKNAIKHFDSASDRFVEIDAEEEAMYMIAEAMANKDILGIAETEVVTRFSDFGRKKAIQMASEQHDS